MKFIELIIIILKNIALVYTFIIIIKKIISLPAKTQFFIYITCTILFSFFTMALTNIIPKKEFDEINYKVILNMIWQIDIFKQDQEYLQTFIKLIAIPLILLIFSQFAVPLINIKIKKIGENIKSKIN